MAANKDKREKTAFEIERQRELERVQQETYLNTITERDIYFITKMNKYVVYTEQKGWQGFDVGAMQRYMGLTSAGDKALFDDVLRVAGRMRMDTAISFRAIDGDTLNLLSKSDWLQPKEGDYHAIFDIVLDSLSGGKKENREHIEQCLFWKYTHPEDYKLPCITISGAGGVCKNEFVEQVLATIFTHRQVVALGVEAAFGEFNGQIIGKTVVFIDEAIVESSDANSLKRKVGNPTISINEKYGLQGSYENTPWYWLGGNGTNGAVMLAKDETDRRYSVMTVQNSVMYWVSKFLGIELPRPGVALSGNHAAVEWYRDHQHIL